MTIKADCTAEASIFTLQVEGCRHIQLEIAAKQVDVNKLIVLAKVLQPILPRCYNPQQATTNQDISVCNIFI